MNAPILSFPRRFRDRVELLHGPVRGGAWSYSLDHVGKFGRSHIGDYDDVAQAFIVAMTWRHRGVPTVVVPS